MTASCCHRLVPQDRFDSILGQARGSDRPEAFEEPLELHLPYRVGLFRSDQRRAEGADQLVTACERCNSPGTLWRDWDRPNIPALCTDCHLDLDTSVAAGHFVCEDWCTRELDHAGLCT